MDEAVQVSGDDEGPSSDMNGPQITAADRPEHGRAGQAAERGSGVVD
jgi:hypothetical protein